MRETIDQFKKHAAFWKRDKPKFMGDFIARPHIPKLLGGNLNNMNILEAGCGSGYLANLLANSGANVLGCDFEEGNLSLAERHPNITYIHSDVKQMSYFSNFFDAVTCSGVLHHHHSGEIESLLENINRSLKNEGVLVVSTPHPYLFSESSPARKDQLCWLNLTPFSAHKEYPYDRSAIFHQTYFDIEGNSFEADVWHHPLSTYTRYISERGFAITAIRERTVSEKDLKHTSWGTATGYPAYLQIVARKVTR